MEQKAQSKTGLVFMEMFKVRASKDQRFILIFINDKTCISISRKYLEKVLKNEQAENSQQEKSS